MYLRGAKLPGRGELVEQRLPEAPRPQHLRPHDRGRGLGLRDRAGGAPVRLPRGADQHADRDGHGALAGRDHRVRRPDLGRAVDARRRVGIHDLAPGGQRRDRVPPGPARRNARRGDPRPDHRRLRFARARGEPRRGHAGRGRRDHELRFPQHHLGRRADGLARTRAEAARARPRAAVGVPRTRRQPPEPRVRLGRARGYGGRMPDRRLDQARRSRAADARRALKRARRRGGGDRPAHGQADRVRHQRGDRRPRRLVVRVQLRLGQRRSVRRVHRAQPDRVRVRRRDHADLRRRVRRPDLHPGAVPVRARQVVRDQRQLVPAVRRRDPDHHADPEPGGSCRRVLQEDAQAPRGPPAGAAATCR